jgi:Restriction endonuclease
MPTLQAAKQDLTRRSRLCAGPSRLAACHRGTLLIVARGIALEKRVEALLRDAGLRPRRRQIVKGARQSDEFDVIVEVKSLGIDGRWVIECKDWSKNVDKGTVLTFLGRVANIGADKGIMVTRTGYQSGCRAAIKNTNVILLTVGELEDFVEEEVAAAALRQARTRLSDLVDLLESMYVRGTRVPGSPFRRGLAEHFPSGPMSELYPERLQAARVLLEQVTLVLAGDEDYRLPDLDYEEDPDENPPDDWYPTLKVGDIGTFAEAVTTLLADWESWSRLLVPPP